MAVPFAIPVAAAAAAIGLGYFLMKSNSKAGKHTEADVADPKFACAKGLQDGRVYGENDGSGGQTEGTSTPDHDAAILSGNAVEYRRCWSDAYHAAYKLAKLASDDDKLMKDIIDTFNVPPEAKEPTEGKKATTGTAKSTEANAAAAMVAKDSGKLQGQVDGAMDGAGDGPPSPRCGDYVGDLTPYMKGYYCDGYGSAYSYHFTKTRSEKGDAQVGGTSVGAAFAARVGAAWRSPSQILADNSQAGLRPHGRKSRVGLDYDAFSSRCLSGEAGRAAVSREAQAEFRARLRDYMNVNVAGTWTGQDGVTKVPAFQSPWAHRAYFAHLVTNVKGDPVGINGCLRFATLDKVLNAIGMGDSKKACFEYVSRRFIQLADRGGPADCISWHEWLNAFFSIGPVSTAGLPDPTEKTPQEWAAWLNGGFRASVMSSVWNGRPDALGRRKFGG